MSTVTLAEILSLKVKSQILEKSLPPEPVKWPLAPRNLYQPSLTGDQQTHIHTQKLQ